MSCTKNIQDMCVIALVESSDPIEMIESVLDFFEGVAV